MRGNGGCCRNARHVVVEAGGEHDMTETGDVSGISGDSGVGASAERIMRFFVNSTFADFQRERVVAPLARRGAARLRRRR